MTSKTLRPKWIEQPSNTIEVVLSRTDGLERNETTVVERNMTSKLERGTKTDVERMNTTEVETVYGSW